MRFWNRKDAAADATHRLMPCLAVVATAMIAPLPAWPARAEEPLHPPSRADTGQPAGPSSQPSRDAGAFARANDRILLMVNRGEFEVAERRASRMLARAETAFGADDPAIIPGLNTLAMIYQQTGRLADAEKILPGRWIETDRL